MNPLSVTSPSGALAGRKKVPPSASPWTPARKHREQTRAAVSQLTGHAAHGPVLEDADQ
jgi:hypothetical protein